MKRKIKKKDPKQNRFNEGNITVNDGFQLDTVEEEVSNGDVARDEALANDDSNKTERKNCDGKIVTDV